MVVLKKTKEQKIQRLKKLIQTNREKYKKHKRIINKIDSRPAEQRKRSRSARIYNARQMVALTKSYEKYQAKLKAVQSKK